MKNFKNFLYKLKIELKNIFFIPLVKYKSDVKFNYDLYWEIRNRSIKKQPNSFHHYRADLLYKFIQENKIPLDTEILDIGSGDGRQLQAIKKRIRNPSITASDISEKALEILSKDFKTIQIKSNKNFISKKFELITAFEVFEHLDEPEESLLYFLSKTESAVVFSVPNTGYIIHRLRLLFGYFPFQWKSHPGEHLRYWTYKDMKWWLSVYLGFDKNEYKIICYAYLFPFFVKIFPFLSSLLAKGLFVQINKKSNLD